MKKIALLTATLVFAAGALASCSAPAASSAPASASPSAKASASAPVSASPSASTPDTAAPSQSTPASSAPASSGAVDYLGWKQSDYTAASEAEKTAALKAYLEYSMKLSGDNFSSLSEEKLASSIASIQPEVEKALSADPDSTLKDLLDSAAGSAKPSAGVQASEKPDASATPASTKATGNPSATKATATKAAATKKPSSTKKAS